MKRCKNCSSTYSDSYALPLCEKCSGELEFFEKSFLKEDKDKIGESHLRADFKGVNVDVNNDSRSQPDGALAISPVDSAATVPKSDNVSGKNQSSKSRLIIIGLLMVIVALFAFILVRLSHSNFSESPIYFAEETTVAEEIVTETEEISTNLADKYAIGKYIVDVGEGLTLNFRKSFEKDAELYTEAIPNGKELVITEIKYIPTAEEAFRYMGKTTYSVNYELCEGWVAMFYLSNAYSSSIVTPGEVTTGEPEQITAAPVQEQTTAASQVNTGKATTPGTYTIDVEPGPGHLRMRSDHSVDSESITLIPAGEKVIVTDVYEDANASDSTLKYWGKVEYAGYTGWIAMWYLK